MSATSPGGLPLWIGAVGCAPVSRIVSVQSGVPAVVEARLGRGSTLQGVVRDESGRPQEGVAVQARTVGQARILRYGPPWATAQARSDPGGHYVIHRVPPGRMHLIATDVVRTATGEARVFGDGGDYRWDPTLVDLVRVAAMVCDPAGRPFADWQLVLRCAGQGGPVRAATDRHGQRTRAP